MPSYLSLLQWTDQGLANAKDAPSRLETAKEAARALGGRMIFFYMLMGEYDFAVLTEFPDDATATRFLLEQTMLGNVRSSTMKAFTEDEYRSIIGSLS
jgi:uncharacterized protein with GYD domain